MGFGFKDGAGGGMTGSILTVTAPAGATVTISKGDKTRTKVAGTDGAVVFRGLRSGEWTVTVTEGDRTFQKQETIKSDYALTVSIFATLHITYPEGSTCTATDGVTTLTAPDTSGTWDCVVPSVGDWTVRITDGTKSKEKVVAISEDGQSECVELSYIIYIVKDGVLTEIGLSNSLTGRLATVTQNEGNVYVNNSYTEYVASVVTGEKIDLTPFTKVVASVNIVTKGTSSTQSKFNGIGLTLTQGVAYSSLADAAAGIEHEALASTTGTMTLTIDAESITGEWYVGFAIGTSGKFYIYDLYLE